MSANLAGRLLELAERYPEQTAIVQQRRGRTRRISFGDLASRVARLGAGLRAEGIGPGSRVLLFVPMSIDLYLAMLATMHAGAVAVFVDAWADRRRMDAAVDAARPDLFIGTPKAHLLRITSPAVRAIPRHWMVPRLHERPPIAPARVEPGTPALITFTTGSTGRPKAAARSHAFLWAQHRVLAGHLGLRSDDVDMPTLPVFVLNNLALGVTSVLPDFDARRPAEIDPERIARQMRAERVTTSSGSPAFYQRLCDWAEPRGERLPLRALWTGGAPVHPPLAKRLTDLLDGQAHVVYGSTEAEPIAGIEAGAMLEAMERSGWRQGICCGVPVPELELRILRPVDGPIELGERGWAEWESPAQEPGEIVVAGPHVLGEYFGAPEETRRHKIRDGGRSWHRTGDAGWVDSQGRLWLVGRVSTRVERDGQTWWSTIAETRALRVPGVRHAAYLQGFDPEMGPKILLVLETDRDWLVEDDNGRRVREALAPFPLEGIYAREHIPRDPRHASKTDTAELLRQLGYWPRLDVHSG